jgi:hypothetical protein
VYLSYNVIVRNYKPIFSSLIAYGFQKYFFIITYLENRILSKSYTQNLNNKSSVWINIYNTIKIKTPYKLRIWLMD